MEFTNDIPLYIRIKKTIAFKGYKIKSVAFNAEIAPYKLYRILNGSRYITTDELAAIAVAISVPIADFFRDAD